MAEHLAEAHYVELMDGLVAFVKRDAEEIADMLVDPAYHLAVGKLLRDAASQQRGIGG